MNTFVLHAASALLKNNVKSRNFSAHFGVPFVVVDTLWTIPETAGFESNQVLILKPSIYCGHSIS